MSKPAARIGDMHDCPRVTPGTGMPHVGGKIIGPGCASVLIGGKPAATVDDVCACMGGLDKITGGSSGVFIGGKPAARRGDKCQHGGKITEGCGSVLIGESMGEYVEPAKEEKEKIISKAIQECTLILERKLKSLERKDTDTMKDFEKWFGRIDEYASQIILYRIKQAIAVSKLLTVDNFEVIEDEFARTKYLAQVRYWDDFYTIYLGDPFWKIKKSDKRTRGGTLVHELSHFDYVGTTVDFDYDVEQCLYLARNYPNRALFNADNFEFFITV